MYSLQHALKVVVRDMKQIEVRGGSQNVQPDGSGRELQRQERHTRSTEASDSIEQVQARRRRANKGTCNSVSCLEGLGWRLTLRRGCTKAKSI